jgi:hypothetical protein
VVRIDHTLSDLELVLDIDDDDVDLKVFQLLFR